MARKFPNETIIKSQGARINQLEEVLAEVYQVIGQFYIEDDALGLTPTMDQIRAAMNREPLPHDSITPYSLPKGAENALERFVMMKKLENTFAKD